MFDAVVLAGSPNTGPLRECDPVENEALIKIGSRMMVEYVLEALKNSSSVGRIALVGPAELKKVGAGEKVFWAEPGDTAIATLIRGLKALPGCKKLLVVTSDVPLLTPAVIEDFLGYCRDSSIDFYYPIVPQEVVEGRFPEVKRTYVTIREGVFTGGNVFVVNADKVIPCKTKAEEFVAARKSPLKLSALFGPVFIIKFLFKKLTIPELEQKFSQILKIKARAFVCPCPEIGFDVDKPSDLEVARKLLAK